MKKFWNWIKNKFNKKQEPEEVYHAYPEQKVIEGYKNYQPVLRTLYIDSLTGELKCNILYGETIKFIGLDKKIKLGIRYVPQDDVEITQ